MRFQFSRLRRHTEGAALVEFALIAPMLLGLMIGVIQIGISMQAYNSMRGVASDTARFAVVAYQNQNEVTDTQIETEGVRIASGAPYLLGNGVEIDVANVDTPRVEGTFEKTVTVRYRPPDIMPFYSFTNPQLTFERSIFLIDE